ncbi:hypothetical protein H310_07717 [Aphanomyces invadans]|uniref:Uncharacterized protein n=1 Tax=Aphanomyces invadans TaxID=157072 RepID=A0A024U057_9STRA|nr:hypothetical protein H310_07717 [Aphanomyces invadans]ETV99648.1 hypothetical protein H310_07717 [Aphanomyces invadans]RHY30282.1 hypothetical protein DYB32_004446 [Aphanomyces invadans]|eukprot:XP_008871424.1 hypothetical protein H310_07717 [Aphanomyces invadans]
MLPTASKRMSAAHKHLLAMKVEGESSLSPSMSSEWRSKYLEKLRINPHLATGVSRDGRAETDPSSRLSAPIMIPNKTRSTSLEDPTYYSPHHRLSWERSLSPLPPKRTSYRTASPESDIDLDIGLFPMGSPELTHTDCNEDVDRGMELDDDRDMHPHNAPTGTNGRWRRGFIPPHQMIQRDCFSLGVQHQFRKRPTGAAVI